jgi:hypothetical protein
MSVIIAKAVFEAGPFGCVSRETYFALKHFLEMQSFSVMVFS